MRVGAGLNARGKICGKAEVLKGWDGKKGGREDDA